MSFFQINCDVGENTGNDELLMPFLDACSIACGGHVGDFQSMCQTVSLATSHHVKIGAHPSFPDKENFGRKVLQMKPDDLIASLRDQLHSFMQVCEKMNVRMEHVKAHGALYNLAAKDGAIARTFILAIQEFGALTILAPWKSALSNIATAHGMQVRYEGFADRMYTKDLGLLSRDHPAAVITDPAKAVRQVSDIFHHHRVETIGGEMAEIRAETFCIHGDNPAAADLVKKLYEVKYA